jgi:two-component system phosphate regulon response regulator PhoB
MRNKILLIDQDAEVGNLLGVQLRAAGFQTITARDGASGLAQARDRIPALIVLDLELPIISGFEVCRQLQADISTRHIPTIILTALASEKHRILGFELGADDYVTKPFSAREVIVRIGKSLERAKYRPEPLLKERMTLGPLTLDPDLHEATLQEKPVRLTPIEFKLLAILMQRNGRTLSRGTLLEEVWSQRGNTDTRTVDSHVRRLRGKLGLTGEAVETVVGYGYRLNEKLISAWDESVKRQVNPANVDLPIPRLEHNRTKVHNSKKSHAGLLVLR